MTRDEFSPRQLLALLTVALSAPLAIVCSGAGWLWVLTAAALAGVFYLLIAYAVRELPSGLGYAGMLSRAYGKWAGRVLAGLYWVWLALGAARAGRMAELAFPGGQGFPLIPLVLLVVAALTAAKSTASVCRFGGVLYLFVAALLVFTLAFGAANVEIQNLRPVGEPSELAGPLSVWLLPVVGLFLLDRMDGSRRKWGRWYLLAAGLAVALSLVCTGALSLPLAKQAANPFWMMSRSISVLGVMERFEALISALLSLGFCCLIALLLAAGRKAMRRARPELGEKAEMWWTFGASVVLLWIVDVIPWRVYVCGDVIFWGIVPVVTLGIVVKKEIEKNRKKGLTKEGEGGKIFER